jgi:hypothetical protein
MPKTWVLHTETKGTGAQMVPLERAKRRSYSTEPEYVRRRPARAAAPEEPKPREPRTFRIVDLMTRQTLVDGAGTREAIDALRDVRSAVDVNVYVWDPGHDRWRLLSFAEKRTMLEYAHQRSST